VARAGFAIYVSAQLTGEFAMPTGPKLCVLFDTDTRNNRALVAQNGRRTADLFAGKADIVSVVHADTPHDIWVAERFLTLSSGQIFEAFPHKKRHQIIPGNVDLKLIAAIERLPEYTHFIRYEYDIWSTTEAPARIGDFCDLVKRNGFGGTDVRSHADEPSWMHWESVRLPDGSIPADDNLVAAFLPLMFFPRERIPFYKEKLEKGWVGHLEALFPIFAREYGLDLVDIGEKGHGFTHINEFNVVPRSGDTPSSGIFIHPVKGLAGTRFAQ
jgi:hypothetical protein